MGRSKKNINKKENIIPEKYFSILFYSILMLVSIIIYSKTRTYDFAIDDKIIIVDNTYVKSGLSEFPKIFEAALNNDMSIPGVTRPVTMFTHALDVSLFGMKAGPQHQMNLFYYIVLLLLLFYFLKTYVLIDQPKLLSFAIVLLFLVHPIHVESVANIKGRDDILSFIFGVIALIFFFRNLEKNSILNQIIVIIGLVFSFLSKETGIIFIVIIPLSYYYFTKVDMKQVFNKTYIYFIFGLVLLVLRFTLFVPPPKYINIYNNSILALDSQSDQLMMTLRILFHYFQLSIWPHPLIWDYSYGHFEFNPSTYIYGLLSIFVFGGISIWAFWKMKFKNRMGFGFLFFTIALAPASNVFIKIASTFGERLLFIPSFGIVFAFVFLLLFIQNKIPVKREQTKKSIVYTILLFVSIIFLFLSSQRVKDWENDDVLISADFKYAKSARSYKAYIQYLTSLPDPKLQNNQKALDACKESLLKFPEEWELWYFRGVIQTTLKDTDDAKLAYEQSLKLNPNKFITLINYGNFFLEEDPDKAIELYKKAVNISKDNPQVIGNLAILLHKQGNLQEAKTYYEMAKNLSYNDKNFNQAYQLLLKSIEK